jgi:hypothetical protein
MPQTHVANNQGFHYPQFRVNPALGAIHAASGAHVYSFNAKLGRCSVWAQLEAGDLTGSGRVGKAGGTSTWPERNHFGRRKNALGSSRSKRQILRERARYPGQSDIQINKVSQLQFRFRHACTRG